MHNRWLLVGIIGSSLSIGGGCEVSTAVRGDGGAGGRDSRIALRCESQSDADGDGIYDDAETSNDFDHDGTPNFRDEDSDGDGASDRDEHGATGGCEYTDLDRDGLADFLDLDADGDGLSDSEERTTYFTDPRNADTDGDGFADLAEVATGRDPMDPNSRVPDDAFYLVLPYEGDSQERELVFGTEVRKADVFFMMDGTGSMDGEHAQLVGSVRTLVGDLAAQIPDVGVGFANFAGFGGNHGDGPARDEPFRLHQAITTNAAEQQAGVARLHTDYGGANWASSNEALYQAATGEGFQPWLGAQRCPAQGGETTPRHGYACFRPGALPVMVVLTDTSSKNGPHTSGAGVYPTSMPGSPRGPHTYDETLRELRRIGARVIGVLSGMEITSPTPQTQFETWARETGTVYADGRPIVFNIASDGTGLDTSIVSAVRTLAEETPQTISATTRDGADRPEEVGPVDARLFIKQITPVSVTDGTTSVTCPTASRCDDERFYGVTPGRTVRFRVRFRNDFQPPRSYAQVFLATIFVLGNGVAELDSREVIIVVPSGSVVTLI